MTEHTRDEPAKHSVVDIWRTLCTVAMRDAARPENSPLSRAGALFDVGYISALLILGPDAASQYEHPTEQVLEAVRARFNWPKSRIYWARWFLQNQYTMGGFRLYEQDRVRWNLLRWAVFMRGAARRAGVGSAENSNATLATELPIAEEIQRSTTNSVLVTQVQEYFEAKHPAGKLRSTEELNKPGGPFGTFSSSESCDALQLVRRCEELWKSDMAAFKDESA
jgi:hypothetical protein